MVWTRRQLDEALTEYQRVLTAARQAPGSIRTAVGDARRFVRWLDGEFDPRAQRSVGRHLANKRWGTKTMRRRPDGGPAHVRVTRWLGRSHRSPRHRPPGQFADEVASRWSNAVSVASVKGRAPTLVASSRPHRHDRAIARRMAAASSGAVTWAYRA